MSEKRTQALELVEQINVKHDYNELILNSTITKYKNSLGLPNISTNELLSQLLELKKDKMYKVLKTLIDYKEMLEDKEQYIIELSR